MILGPNSQDAIQVMICSAISTVKSTDGMPQQTCYWWRKGKRSLKRKKEINSHMKLEEIQTSLEEILRLKRTASGPDELPNWLFRDFAYDLAPAITDVFKSSLRQHKVPSSWKMADIKPLPKESPLTCCTQLRPISLTAVIMRLFERLVYRFELSNICNNYIDFDLFAYRGGHNSTMALIKCQHTWLKWLDG